ncbi:hypothetical protein C8R45DRAFT_5234 [Mycena sanguinolenta]|nr:hypothetical protein C8R45DRAFT_5234 [Mycena sanguinolenta]
MNLPNFHLHSEFSLPCFPSYASLSFFVSWLDSLQSSEFSPFLSSASCLGLSIFHVSSLSAPIELSLTLLRSGSSQFFLVWPFNPYLVVSLPCRQIPSIQTIPPSTSACLFLYSFPPSTPHRLLDPSLTFIPSQTPDNLPSVTVVRSGIRPLHDLVHLSLRHLCSHINSGSFREFTASATCQLPGPVTCDRPVLSAIVIHR